MSYILRLRTVPEHQTAQWERRQELEACHDELLHLPRGHPEKEAAFAAMMACEDPTYVQFSTDAMGELRTAMDAVGMIATEGEPTWEQPAIETVPVKSEIVDGVEEHFHDTDSPEFVYWQEACLYRPEGSVGIAWWKVCSDDWWIVTAEECSEALAAWRSLSEERQRSIVAHLQDFADPFWHELLGYLDMGADGDGLRVS